MSKRAPLSNPFLRITPSEKADAPEPVERKRPEPQDEPSEAPAATVKSTRKGKKPSGYVPVTLSLPPATERKLVAVWMETRTKYRKSKYSRIVAIALEYLFEDYEKNGDDSRLAERLKELEG